MILHYLNRFDLIFLMLDPQDELYDKRLARHLVSLYYSAAEENESDFMVKIQSFLNSNAILIQPGH